MGKRGPVVLLVVVAVAACASKPAPAPSGPGTPGGEAPPAAGPPGSIGVTCKAIAPGHHDYTTTTLAPNLDICSVGGDGMLTLVAKGDGADRVHLHLADYHGPGNYPLTGKSNLNLGNRIAGAGAAQSTQNCSASRCSAQVTDRLATAPAGTPHALDFAVTCPQVCDVDSHVCTLSPGGSGGPITWTFHANCAVR